MSDWITNRLPTEEDAPHGNVLRCVPDSEGRMRVYASQWVFVKVGEPWMPMPAPYVKPKPWTVEWNNIIALWSLRLNGEHHGYLPYPRLSNEAAHRIAAIYNEVMP